MQISKAGLMRVLKERKKVKARIKKRGKNPEFYLRTLQNMDEAFVEEIDFVLKEL